MVPEVVYDPNQAAHAYDGYVDPAAAHGWQEPATAHDDARDTAPLPRVPEAAPGAPRHAAVFVDGSGRRRRLMRIGGIGLGATCVVFLGAVVTGLFGSSPSNGPLPWSDGHDSKEQRAEHSAPASRGPAPATSGPASEPSTSASPAREVSESPKKEADPAVPASRSTTAAPTTVASTTAPARGNSEGKPGRGNGSPKANKGPK